MIKTLLPYARKKIPIIGLEPSCILTIIDDYSSLVRTKEAQEVASMCTTYDQFMDSLLQAGKWNFEWKKGIATVKLHGHCHQKALVGTRPTMRILKAMPGLEVSEIDSGCCGMAGSFGYEKEHYNFSLKVGETRLFPEIRKSKEGTLFVANGISCRSQIWHATDQPAMHLAELIYSRLL